MNILLTLLTVLDVLIALLIIALVLVQQSKSGGGLGTTFGGGGSDSLFAAHASDAQGCDGRRWKDRCAAKLLAFETRLG